MRLWPLGRVVNWAARQPGLRRVVHNEVKPEESRHIIIPVNRVVSGTQSAVLPYTLLDDLIARSSQRVALNWCLCRRADHCRDYPRELGCLFLGDAAAQINPELGHKLDHGAALEHAQQAMELGLVPLVVHSAYDAHILGIELDRMLAVCFCCDCCCSVRRSLREGHASFGETVLRLPGLTVEVGPGCTGCGVCVELCHAGAIALEDGRAVIGSDCKGCGRCAANCPEGAIEMRMDGLSTAAENLYALVSGRTQIGPAIKAG
jgi:ferredoxin